MLGPAVRVLPRLSFTVTVPADAPVLNRMTAAFPVVGVYVTVNVVAPALSEAVAPPTYSGDATVERRPIAKASQAVEVIVTDQQMPDMTCAEFLAAAKQLTLEVPGLLLTSCIAGPDLVAAVNLGQVQFYLTKPWDAGELLTAVRAPLVLLKL